MSETVKGWVGSLKLFGNKF